MANQNPGIYITRSAGADIPVPVSGETVAWDNTNLRWIEWNGTVWVPAAVSIFDVSSGNPAFDVVNTAATQTVYSKSIPGGMLSANSILRMTWEGDILNNVDNSRTIAFQLQLGGNTFALNASLTLGTGGSFPSTNRAAVSGTVVIRMAGATNRQFIRTRITVGGANSVGALADVWHDQITALPLSVDMTTAQLLVYAVAFGSASPNLEYRQFGTSVEYL